MSNDIPDALFKRMTLANQYRILALLDVDNEEVWKQATDKALEGWPVDDLPDVQMLQSYLRDALTREDQNFVLDALNVFELIQDGIGKGYTVKSSHGYTEFPGFDGNNETKLMAYARHVVEQEHRFEYVKRSALDYNSHMPTVEIYQRMIRVWERMGRPHQINEELFDMLIAAQLHPSFGT